MKSPVQWPKLPFWVGLRCLPWGIRKAIRTNCRHPGTMGWCQLNKIHWPQRRGRGTLAKSSPIGSDLPSPESVKEIGSRSCFWSWCHRQKETLFAHFFSFLVPTCHLKHPSNKLKEPCQVAHSIINQTCLSWASWQIKRTVSLLHRVLRPLSCAQQPPQGKDKEDNALNVAKWPRRGPAITMWSRLDYSCCCPSELPQGHWCWAWTWSTGLKFPIWRPTGLFTWLHSSRDLRNREVTFCP